MDSLSQIVLGASVAEAVLGKKIGNKALLWGAIAGTIPDLDVISNWWLSEFDAMSSHRGFTHSILFCIIAPPILGWLIQRFYSWWRGRRNLPPEASFWNWTMLSFWCFATHIALDCCTSWGTMIFWPSDYRFSTNSIFVADPLYTLPFLLLCLVVLFFKRRNPTRRAINFTGLALSTAYLALGMVNKYRVNEVMVENLEAQQIEAVQWETRPAPLNIILWMAEAETQDSILIGFYSLLDEDKNIAFRRFAKGHEHLAPYMEHPDVQKIIHMSEGYYTVTPTDSCLIVNDLRFGLMSGWDPEGKEDFVFRYFLTMEDGDVIVDFQDPPDPNGEEAADFLKLFYRRIKGDKLAVQPG